MKKTRTNWNVYRIFKWSILIFPIIFVLLAITSFIIELIEPTDCIPEFCVSVSRMFFGIYSWVLAAIFIPYAVIYIIILVMVHYKRKKK